MQPQVVFEGHQIQGKVHSAFIDMHYGKIYFCESHYPELYETPAPEPEAPASSGQELMDSLQAMLWERFSGQTQ